ncbi:phosphatidate cytidylyltransferase, partial [Acinetobacter bereziniae]|nr:phosphatidate cytidylyltransferase [Acinetobacter bereziniae]
MIVDNLDKTYLLFGIFAGILVFASSVGFILKQKAGHQPAPVIDNLNARINAWWVMLIVIGAAILLGQTAFIILFGIISLFALREFTSLLPT